MIERPAQTRREMLCTLGRYVALGGLALGALKLVTKQETSPEPGDECVRDFKCARCGLVTDCQLPQGVAARMQRNG